MKVRVISSIVGLLIAFYAVWQFDSIILNVLGVVIFAIALSEIYVAFKKGNSKLFFIITLIPGGFVILSQYIKFPYMIVASIFAISLATIVVFEFKSIDFKTFASSIFFSAFVLFGLYSISRLKVVLPSEQFGIDAAFLFVYTGAIAWGGDVMAYFAGYFFGKHKLSAILSPKKTVEGAIGGVVGSIFFSTLMIILYSYIKPWVEGTNIEYTIQLNQYVVFGAVAAIGSCFGIIGDLFASAIKRQCNIKDFGSIMPGHGGALDRFDSFLLVAPLISILGDYIAQVGGII